jgi:hypothetical protein
MTVLKNWLAGWRVSLTHLWANVVILLTAIISSAWYLIDQIGDLFNDPNLKTQLQTLIPATYWPWVLVGVMVATKMARNRSVNPVAPPHN